MDCVVRLYVDLDGVLADFDSAAEKILGRRPGLHARLSNAEWAFLKKDQHFYFGLGAMPDAMDLWRYIEPHDPIILTGLPVSMPDAEANKHAWCAFVLGPHVRVECCQSKDKCLHAKPGDILIDDWERYQQLWEQAGGIWITHTSAENSIRQLKERGL
jgi:hypothetical protein